MIDFHVEWIGWDGRVVLHEIVRKRDLTAAIGWAARRVVGQKDAHGFFVHTTRAERKV